MAGNAENDRRVDYIEFVTRDIARAKAFYAGAFGCVFTDYGPEYAAFFDGRLNGGFMIGDPDGYELAVWGDPP